MTREQFISDLRLAANLFEQHPEITVLPSPYLFASVYDENAKEVLAAFAKAAGKVKKDFRNDEIRVEFYLPGGMMIRYDAAREKVCERVVVDTRVIPERVIPAFPETVIPARVEEIVEWRCHPLLGAEVQVNG